MSKTIEFVCECGTRVERDAHRQKSMDGVMRCSPCQNRYRVVKWQRENPKAHLAKVRRWRYGRIAMDYLAYWESQGRICDLCSKYAEPGSEVVEHDHDASDYLDKGLRGITHQSCNIRLGHIERNLREGKEADLTPEASQYLFGESNYTRWASSVVASAA